MRSAAKNTPAPRGEQAPAARPRAEAAVLPPGQRAEHGQRVGAAEDRGGRRARRRRAGRGSPRTRSTSAPEDAREVGRGRAPPGRPSCASRGPRAVTAGDAGGAHARESEPAVDAGDGVVPGRDEDVSAPRAARPGRAAGHGAAEPLAAGAGSVATPTTSLTPRRAGALPTATTPPRPRRRPSGESAPDPLREEVESTADVDRRRVAFRRRRGAGGRARVPRSRGAGRRPPAASAGSPAPSSRTAIPSGGSGVRQRPSPEHHQRHPALDLPARARRAPSSRSGARSSGSTRAPRARRGRAGAPSRPRRRRP